MHGLTCCKKNPDLGLLLIRLGLGTVFFAHGIQKMQGIDSVVGFFGALGLPPFFAYLVAGVETLGGLAMIVGLWTHWAAKLLAIIMIVAIALVKGSKDFWVGTNSTSCFYSLRWGCSSPDPGNMRLMSE